MQRRGKWALAEAGAYRGDVAVSCPSCPLADSGQSMRRERDGPKYGHGGSVYRLRDRHKRLCRSEALGLRVLKQDAFISLSFKRSTTLPLQYLSKMTLGAPQESKPTDLHDARSVLLHLTLSGTVTHTSLAARESRRLQPPQPTINHSSSPGPKPTPLPTT